MARDILVVPINVSTDLYIESIDSPSVVSNNTRVFYARKATDTEYGVVKLTDITAVIGGSRVLNMTGAEILAAASDDTIIVGSVAYCNLDGDIYEQSKLYKLNSDREWVEIDSKYVSEALNAHDIDVTAHDNLFTLKLDKKPDGSVNLIGTDYKIDEKYLPPFAVSGGLVFGGTFGADGLIVATSRTPELNGTLIDNITLATYPSVYFKATASYEFGGKSYDAGDIAICNGDITPNWTKIDGSDAVTGVKGNNEVAYRLGNVNITKDNIGLGEVDNTSDEDKPISTATKSYVDEELVKKANLDGATFSGNITIGSTETPKNLEVKGTTTVTTPTADLHAATKKYVDDAVIGNPIVTSWSDPLSDLKVPSEKLTKDSLDLKADKVESATNGNFAALNSTGNITDSGKKASDFANLTGGNSFTGVQSLTGTELNLLKLQNTDSASYSRIQYIGTGKTFNAGVGNSSADLTALRDKFYIYDATGSKVLFTIDSDGNIENLGNVNLPTGKTYKINNVDVISDKAKVDASNLNSDDVLAWQNKLSNKIVDFTTTSLTTAFTISGLDLQGDGGEYDILISSSTNKTTDVFLYLNDDRNGNYSQIILNAYNGATAPTISSALFDQQFYCGVYNTSHSDSVIKLMVKRANRVFYKNSSYSTATGNSSYFRETMGNKNIANVTSFTIYTAATDSHFNAGTRIQVYKRG